MGETGRVISADNEYGTVTVSLKRSTACEGCKACIMGRESGEMLITASNVGGAVEGDMVVVELGGERFVQAALIMYGIPLAALVAGGVAGSVLFGGEAAWALIVSLGCMGAALLGIRIWDGRRDKGRYTPVAELVKDDECGGH